MSQPTLCFGFFYLGHLHVGYLICIYTNTLYITIIVVFLTAFLHVLVYLVLRYTTGMTLLKKAELVDVPCKRKVVK